MTSAWSATMSGGEDRPAEGRGVLAGAFQLLEALVGLSDAGLTAVAAASGLPKATAHRLLQQLCDVGAVERRGGNYRVGHRMFQLGKAWQPSPGLVTAAHHPSTMLAQASGASVAVCMLCNGQTVFVSGVVGEGPLALLDMGATVPWRTAAGKVLVAHSQPIATLGLASEAWIRERETIRESGVAFDREEVVPGVCCVAVPVRGRDGDPIAAVAAVGTPGTRLPELAIGLRRAGDTITAALRAGTAR